jgi:hypothetical protein
MLDTIDSTAFNFEQGQRARKLFAAVVLAALDDAIADDKKYGNGPTRSPAGPGRVTAVKCCPAPGSTRTSAWSRG